VNKTSCSSILALLHSLFTNMPLGVVPRRLFDIRGSPFVPLKQSPIVYSLTAAIFVNSMSLSQHRRHQPATTEYSTRSKPDANPLNKRYLFVFAACSSASRIFARALFEPPSFGPLGGSFAPFGPGAGAGLRCCCRASSTDS
jgi:hypothetical protein